MDLTLSALKLLIAELQASVHVNGATFLGELKFQRVWVQGVVVSPLKHGTLVLDDGSAVIELSLMRGHQAQLWEAGMYVLINGRYCEDSVPFIEVHKIVNLSSEPDREAAWYLEVAETHKMFYEAKMKLHAVHQDEPMQTAAENAADSVDLDGGI